MVCFLNEGVYVIRMCITSLLSRSWSTDVTCRHSREAHKGPEPELHGAHLREEHSAWFSSGKLMSSTGGFQGSVGTTGTTGARKKHKTPRSRGHSEQDGRAADRRWQMARGSHREEAKGNIMATSDVSKPHRMCFRGRQAQLLVGWRPWKFIGPES